jgi:outer membrane protein OmpA-like peptidoglycan-associated protein
MRSDLAAAALVLALAFGTPAPAQIATEGQVVGLTFETQNLRSETVDLVFTVEDLGGAIAGLGGGVGNLQVTETETEIRIELSGDVLFDFDKADIRAEAGPVLLGVANVLKKFPQAAVRIGGYTDSKGSDNYNLKLSERRAASVKAWLVRNGGVAGAKLTTRGFGEADPVAPNARPDGSDNPEGRQKNRRVEIAVQK